MLVDIRGQAPDKPGIINTTLEITLILFIKIINLKYLIYII
jgi:hypothetical protein